MAPKMTAGPAEVPVEQPVVEEPGQCELGCGRRMPVDELPERGDRPGEGGRHDREAMPQRGRQCLGE
jgi:hypothetical protein